MEEKIYKTMGSTGAASLAVGICVLTVSYTHLRAHDTSLHLV